MSNEENLRQAVEKWRRGVKSERTEGGDTRPKNPYGQKIYDLNYAWGDTKRAHEEKIKAEYEEYKSTLADLSAKSEAWKREYDYTPSGVASGRPQNPDYSDEVKIAAAALYRERGAKTMVRILLGTSDTARLNRALAEGEALLQSREAEEDW